jgi:regulatory protein
MIEKRTIKLTPKEALLKLANYCAYQERCHYEVKNKLAEYGLFGEWADEVIAELITQNYLNEERFAKAFAGGKFRIKKWGRNKIKQELKLKQVSSYCIDQGLKEIDFDDYLNILKNEAIEKFESTKDKNILIKSNKVAKYLITRGFEQDLVWDTIKSIQKKHF